MDKEQNKTDIKDIPKDKKESSERVQEASKKEDKPKNQEQIKEKSRKVIIENTLKKIFGDQVILRFSTKQLTKNNQKIKNRLKKKVLRKKF